MNRFLRPCPAALSAALIFTGCHTTPMPATDPATMRTEGTVERLDPRFDALIPPGTELEVVADGFGFSEGPVWVRKEGHLLFSDIPNNRVMRWHEQEGLSEFLKPSGYTGTDERRGGLGSNGLTLDSRGQLILCQHGDRRIARLDKDGSFETIADRFMGRRLNSPNDAVFKSNGDLYFTDPPYGLPRGDQDPSKEIPFQGVYRLGTDGQLTLLTSDLSRPNGIAFSPDEKTLYVANSDPERALWMAYPVKEDGTLAPGRVLRDVTLLVGKRKGLPDGLKVDARGHIWATGPGGVLVLTPEGDHLGTLRTGEATGNCAWGNDGSVLYITASMYLMRVRTTTQGKLP